MYTLIWMECLYLKNGLSLIIHECGSDQRETREIHFHSVIIHVKFYVRIQIYTSFKETRDKI